jgi:hypothetical protein
MTLNSLSIFLDVLKTKNMNWEKPTMTIINIEETNLLPDFFMAS